MKARIIGAVIAFLIVAGLVFGYLVQSNATQGVASTTTMVYSTIGANNLTTTFSAIRTTFAPSAAGNPIPVSKVETSNYSVPGGTYAFDSNTNRMYILDTSSLSVVDTSSFSVIATVELPANNTGGSINAGLTFDTGTNTIYSAVQGEVVAVNGSTNTILRELPLSLGTLAFDQVTHKLWGTQPDRSALVEVDPQSGSVQVNVSIGFSPYDIEVDPGTGLVYSDGCHQEGLACDSWMSVVNGTSGTVVAKVELGSGDYPTMALDPASHVLYVSGGQQLAAINGTTGAVIFNVNPQTCGPFTDMVVDPSSNLVLAAPATSYNYLLAYDGATGKLVNMYSFPSTPVPVALNPHNGDLYLWTTSGSFLSIRLLSATGNVNTALIGAGRQCALP